MRLTLPILAAASAIASVAPAQPRSINDAGPVIARVAGKVGEVTGAPNGQRFYYVTGEELWMYEFASRKATKVATGEIWNIQVSARSDRLTFARGAEDGRGAFVWTLPLNPATGLASGPARRVGVVPGDQPAFSPDGQSIAFAAYVDDGSHNRLAVMPASGGPVRYLVDAPRGIAPIRWAGDGRTIYYGATLDSATRGQGFAQYLVAASGGEPRLLGHARAWSNPGLSPDGRLIAFAPRLGGGMSVMDAQGKEILRLAFPATASAKWLTGSELLTWSEVQASSVSSLSIGDGKQRQLLPGKYMRLRDVEWSTDGKRLAALAEENGKAVLLVSSGTGGGLRTISLDEAPIGLAWSPDSRNILLRMTETRALVNVDATTWSVKKVLTIPGNLGAFVWTSDSRRIRYISNTGSDSNRAREVREADLNGADRSIRSLGTAGPITFLSDTLLTHSDPAGATLINLRTGASARLAAGGILRPTMSPRGDVLAIRPSAAGARPMGFDLVTADGKLVRKLGTSIVVGNTGLRAAQFTPDGKRLVISGLDTAQKRIVIQEVPIDGSPARTLATLPAGAEVPYLALSPDGKTLLYTNGGTVENQFRRIDVGALAKSAGKK